MNLLLFFTFRLGHTVLWRIGAVLRLFWRRCAQVCSWTLRELADPLVCYLSITLGVMGTSVLPAFIAARFYLPDETAAVGWLSAFVIAWRVFDSRAYPRWRASGAPLAARMFCAASDGVAWPYWLLCIERIEGMTRSKEEIRTVRKTSASKNHRDTVDS